MLASWYHLETAPPYVMTVSILSLLLQPPYEDIMHIEVTKDRQKIGFANIIKGQINYRNSCFIVRLRVKLPNFEFAAITMRTS